MLSTLVNVCYYVYLYIRPALKWFLRRTTNMCELQRICYGEKFGYSRTSKIETSLGLSHTIEVQQMIEQLNKLASQGRFVGEAMKNCMDYAVKMTIDVKEINPKVHKPFIHDYRKCLNQIFGYKQLLYEVEILRKTPYSSENNKHEEKLLKLWDMLNPNSCLQSRISKQWSDIGFQGEDPKTDFRGMGILGLDNLLYFATEYCDVARHVLLHSHHPDYGYSFAIVGINLTSMAYHMLQDESLKVHFYNSREGHSIECFHHVYCYLFYEFDKFWLSEKPRDIMEFSRIRAKFEANVLNYLKNPNTILRLSHLTQTL